MLRPCRTSRRRMYLSRELRLSFLQPRGLHRNCKRTRDPRTDPPLGATPCRCRGGAGRPRLRGGNLLFSCKSDARRNCQSSGGNPAHQLSGFSALPKLFTGMHESGIYLGRAREAAFQYLCKNVGLRRGSSINERCRRRFCPRVVARWPFHRFSPRAWACSEFGYGHARARRTRAGVDAHSARAHAGFGHSGWLTPTPYLAWSSSSKWLLSLYQGGLDRPHEIVRFSVETGEKQAWQISPTDGNSSDRYGGLAISRNGRTLAFTLTRNMPISDVYTVPISEDLLPIGPRTRPKFEGNRSKVWRGLPVDAASFCPLHGEARRSFGG